MLGCFSPSRIVSTWWLFPNPPLIAYPSKWYVIKSYAFFCYFSFVFFCFLFFFYFYFYFAIVNSAVSWCGDIDYFTDSGAHHLHHRLLTDSILLPTTTISGLLVACSAGVLRAGESCLFMFVLLKPPSLIL